MVEERRKHKRYRLDLETQLKLDFETVLELELDREYVDATTFDISVGGICLVAHARLERKTTFDVYIRVMDNNRAETPPVVFSAVAVWCTKLGERRFQIGARLAGPRDRAKAAALVQMLQAGAVTPSPEQIRELSAFDVSDVSSDQEQAAE